MNNQQIADRLWQLVDQGNYDQAYDELFHPEVVAIEPQLSEMGLGEVTGIPAVKQKVAALSGGIGEIISREMSSPIVSANHIAFTNIVAAKGKDGSNINISEICLYTVENGKIISEQFFY